MSNTNTGGPAFPIERIMLDSKFQSFPGMTLRDYFAAKATDEDVNAKAGVLREVSPMRILPEGWRSTARYMHADDMLKARES
jgi:hypothetical protein